MTYHFRKAAASEAKPIFPLSPSYCVNVLGQVFRDGRDVPLRPVLQGQNGYLQVSLWEDGKGRTWFVHHIVTITFHGPRPSLRHHAAHRDGNKINNAANNLRWLTKEENEAEKVLHGRSNRGDRNGMSKASRMKRGEL